MTRHSSIIPIISDEDTDSSCTESDTSWMGPQNQLGLEPRRDDEEIVDIDEEVVDEVVVGEEVALNKKGEIKHYEAFQY